MCSRNLVNMFGCGCQYFAVELAIGPLNFCYQ
jgi:hypothetical protein